MTDEPPLPSGAPPGWEVPPPGGAAPPISAPTYPPPAYPAAAYPAAQVTAKTEPFAIVSLVVALGGLVVWIPVIGGIVAVVFGHLARGRIKRRGTQGRGMALAGVIIGYIQIALSIIFVAVFVGFVVSMVTMTNDAQDDAFRLGEEILLVAARDDVPARSSAAVSRAIHESGIDAGDVTLGRSGIRAVDATTDQLDAEFWELRVSPNLFGEACLLVPTEASRLIIVNDSC